MPVTELALLHIRSGEPLSSRPPNLNNTLRAAQEAQAIYSHHPVHFFAQHDDPSYIYLLGGWDSVAQHLDEWIPSETNQALLASLRDEIEVVWMFHVDVDGVDFGVDAGMERVGTTAAVSAMALGRYFVKEGREGEVVPTLRAHFEEVVAGLRSILGGGWRMDRQDEEATEFVLLLGGDEGSGSAEMSEVSEKVSGWIESLTCGEEVRCGMLLEV